MYNNNKPNYQGNMINFNVILIGPCKNWNFQLNLNHILLIVNGVLYKIESNSSNPIQIIYISILDNMIHT